MKGYDAVIEELNKFDFDEKTQCNNTQILQNEKSDGSKDIQQVDIDLLKNIFDSISDGISVLNTNLEIILVNKKMRELYKDKLPFSGRKCFDIYQNRSSICPWCPSKKAIENKSVESTSVPYPSETNPKGWLLLTCFPLINSSNEVYGVIEQVKDITKERIIAKQVRDEKVFIDSILKSLPGVFYLFDEKGRFIRWNKNFEIVTEYSSDELKMMTPIDLFDTDEKQKIASAIQKAFETGYADVKGKFLTKTGKKIPYFFTGVATVYQEKNLLVGVGIDLSNIQQTKTELNKRIKELETVEQLAVNRELKMIKLKKEVNELLKNNGLEEKYEIDES